MIDGRARGSLTLNNSCLGVEPNDLAASMGLPGAPDHKERVQWTKKIDDKARKQKKIVASDIMNTTDIHTLMLDNARTFVEKNS